SVFAASLDLDAGQDAWINTCVNGIGERAGNADLLSCILAFRYGFGISDSAAIGDPADWFTRQGRVVLTGEYGGKAGFRHVLDGLGLEVADEEEDLVFSLVQLC